MTASRDIHTSWDYDRGVVLSTKNNQHNYNYLKHSTAVESGSFLRAPRERPRHHAAEQRDELAALHSITSSARASSVAGTSSPSAFAVFRLMTSSTIVACCTGRSAG